MSSFGRDIVIVGAGVFGAAAALTLRRRGWAVTLVDRGAAPHPAASSTDVSKMVRTDYGADTFYHDLALASLDRWEAWNAEWPRPLFHADGFLVLAAERMSPGGYEYESHRVLIERGQSPERIGGEALGIRCPKWNAERYQDGYLNPRGGWAESEAVVGRLLDLAVSAGVRRRDETVDAVLTTGSRAHGVRISGPGAADTPTISADVVLVCAGAWTPSLVPSTSPLLRSVAQPVLYFLVEHPDAYRGPAFPPFAADIAGSGWYGFPALDDGRVKLGHHGPGRVAAPDDRGDVPRGHVERARAFLADAIPSLATAPVAGSRMCMYCDSRDGDLLIDHDPEVDGLVVAAGGSGHAFKFAPMIGEIIADAVERHPSRWLSRFAWRAPGDADTEAARAVRPSTPGAPSTPFTHTTRSEIEEESPS